MTFSLEHHWVWDFWLADDGDIFHLFYLHAPKSLGDPRLRHRNARVGHATSVDLTNWTDHGVVLTPGGPGAFDETATWTGSIVRDRNGAWRMFYTGSSFLAEDSDANIETIGVATSVDLHDWVKHPDAIARADPRWYEVLDTSAWPEEAWRDPWVFEDPGGAGWHMLVTARSNHGSAADRGVIGHATSDDLDNWVVRAPLSEPGAGFAHLEVPQLVAMDDGNVLVFSCDSGALAGARAGRTGGIWTLAVDSMVGPFAVQEAELLADETLYSGRIVRARSGEWSLLAFENTGRAGAFVGRISDPVPLRWTPDGMRIASTAGIA